MASRDNTTTIPQGPRFVESSQVSQSEAGDGESILSSRMTDIASEDGEQPGDSGTAQKPGGRRSVQTNSSRPNTGVTGASSQRSAWPQGSASRRGFNSSNTQRVSTSTTGPRPQSSTSRSHVPSLTSHAFFRPMSSQRLQAQRGGPRPATLAQQGIHEDGLVEGGSVGRNSLGSNPTMRQHIQEDPDGRPPPSRGTEMTEQETAERVTANTSPTHGHHPTGSLTESVRPLQRNPANPKGLSLTIDNRYGNGNGIATPSKSPRSFRSGFLMPSRGDAAPGTPNRSTHGREKLSSVASSPGLTSVHQPSNLPKNAKLGSNYEYFTGNTVFCWGGRLQNTRHRPINVVTGLLFVIPGALFFAFSAPWLWHNISPAIPIVLAYIFYIAMSSFIRASVTDPGVRYYMQPSPTYVYIS